MNDEKNILKAILEFINDLGADQDDSLELLESEISQINLIKSIFDEFNNEYLGVLLGLENDLLNEQISLKEYKFGKKIADLLCLKRQKIKNDLDNKLNILSGKLEVYKSLVSNLKSKYDLNNERLNKIIKFESQNIDGLKGTNIKLIQRPIGIHPGNPIAARRNNKLILEPLKNDNNILHDLIVKENLNIEDLNEDDVLENNEDNNENIHNVLNQLNSLLDESGNKIKIVNKDLIANEIKENKKRGRKSNKN